MPKKITCKNTISHSGGIEFPVNADFECGSDTFIQANQLFLFSAFENPQGQAGMQVTPVFKCTECGALVDLDKAREEATKPQFNINGK